MVSLKPFLLTVAIGLFFPLMMSDGFGLVPNIPSLTGILGESGVNEGSLPGKLGVDLESNVDTLSSFWKNGGVATFFHDGVSKAEDTLSDIMRWYQSFSTE